MKNKIVFFKVVNLSYTILHYKETENMKNA
jgi:hypothetical protein